MLGIYYLTELQSIYTECDRGRSTGLDHIIFCTVVKDWGGFCSLGASGIPSWKLAEGVCRVETVDLGYFPEVGLLVIHFVDGVQGLLLQVSLSDKFPYKIGTPRMPSR